MTIFSWLLLGHLVGDFVLQNDWMAQGKRKGLITLPGMIHFIIYTCIIILALVGMGLFAKSTLFAIGVLTLVFVSHWLIDATDVVDAWMRFYGQRPVSIIRLAVDQTFHLLVLAGVALIW